MALSLDLAPPPGPIAVKYSSFVYIGEPGHAMYPEVHYVGEPNTRKTTAMIDALIISALDYPGANLALVRDTAVNLLDTTYITLYDRARPLFDSGDFKYISSKNTVVVSNGSRIRLFGLDVPGAEDALLGYEPFRAFVDQAEGIQEELLNTLLTRLARKVPNHAKTGRPGYSYVKLTANFHHGRNWIARRTEDGAKEIAPDVFEKQIPEMVIFGKRVAPKRLLIKARTQEVDFGDSSQFAEMVALAGGLENKFFTGDWNSQQGIIFPEFKPAFHLLSERPLLEGTTGVVGLDHGVNHPTVAVMGARDFTGTVHVIGEYVEPDRSAKQNASSIASRLVLLHRLGVQDFIVYADSSIWSRGKDLTSIADDYIEVFSTLPMRVELIPSTRKQIGSQGMYILESGISRIKEWLLARNRFGAPMVTFTRGEVPKTIAMIQDITYKNIEKDTWGICDVFDAFRYMIVNTPESISSNPYSKSVKSNVPRYIS